MNSPTHIHKAKNQAADQQQSVPAIPACSYSKWDAQLDLVLEKNIRGTRISRCHHKGPLYVQRPFYPEGRELAHVYLLHPPGGVVSGDELAITITLKPHAQALITTPGAGRVYRARQDKARQGQSVTIRVEPGAHLEWFPQENIIFPGAHASLRTRIDIEKDAYFIGWDISSFGLPAQKAWFTQGELNQKLAIYLDGVPKIIEHLAFGERNFSVFHNLAGLQNKAINGIFIAGPIIEQGKLNETEAEALIARIREQIQVDSCSANTNLFAISLNNNFIVARFLGDCSAMAKTLFSRVWTEVRPALLDRAACPPRIWLT